MTASVNIKHIINVVNTFIPDDDGSAFIREKESSKSSHKTPFKNATNKINSITREEWKKLVEETLDPFIMQYIPGSSSEIKIINNIKVIKSAIESWSDSSEDAANKFHYFAAIGSGSTALYKSVQLQTLYLNISYLDGNSSPTGPNIEAEVAVKQLEDNLEII